MYLLFQFKTSIMLILGHFLKNVIFFINLRNIAPQIICLLFKGIFIHILNEFICNIIYIMYIYIGYIDCHILLVLKSQKIGMKMAYFLDATLFLVILGIIVEHLF